MTSVKQASPTLIKGMVFVLVLAAVAGLLAGCDGGGGGGGGGGGTVGPGLVSLHTGGSVTPAVIKALGTAYPVAVSVWETRGDPIELNAIRTYRTYADYSNSGRTDFYVGDAGYVYGWMFDKPGATSGNIRDAVIYDASTAPTRDLRKLQGYEKRTISTYVMVGNPYQSRPSWFNGIFIINSQYKEWMTSGKTGIKYWIRLEGYDYRLNDTYNINMPLEIRFEYSATDPYSGGTGSGTDPYSGGTGTGTDPYSGGTDPYGSSPQTGTSGGTDPYEPYSR